MAGTILIPVGLLIIMNNERKLVSYIKVLTEARNEYRSIQVYMPEEAHDFKLVHAVGNTKSLSIGDRAFGAYVRDSYRLVREV